MCLILLNIDSTPDHSLTLIANRDEFHSRPARPLNFWKTSPHILAGKDLEAGGTWMGVNKKGRFAALTNFRDMASLKSVSPSRGEIIPDLLSSESPIPDFLKELDKTGADYNGFNLLTGEKGYIYWYSNQSREVICLPPGIHGLSNHLMNTPWPKVEKGKEKLKDCIDRNTTQTQALFEVLTDQHRPHDRLLPETGIGIEWERILSPVFIQSPNYGTRCSTILKIHSDGKIEMIERTFMITEDPSPGGEIPRFTDRQFSFYPDKTP